MSVPVIAVVASAIAFAPLCSWLALQRGRSWAVWFIFGMALGPIAAGLLLAAPPGICGSCGTRSRGWPRHCQGCGLAFTLGHAPAAVGEPAEEARSAFPAATSDPASAASAFAPAGSSDPEPPSVRPLAERAGPAGEPGRRSATALGRRPTSSEAPVALQRSSGTVAILGSAIFMGGSASLQIGSRYLLALVGLEVHVLGPMHTTPSAIAARLRLADCEATVVGDRLVISRGAGAGISTLAFSGVAAEPGVDLQEQLSAWPRRETASV